MERTSLDTSRRLDTEGPAEQAPWSSENPAAVSPGQEAGPPPPEADEASVTGGKTRGFSRRRLVGAAGVAGLLGIAGFGGATLARRSEESAPAAVTPTQLVYPFRGPIQQGILTPAQDNMYTAAFDVTTDNLEEVKNLLKAWTAAAEDMSTGQRVGGEPHSNREAPPTDTGEVWGYPPSGLTVTFGFGRSLFVDERGEDRFGLRHKMPAVLAEGVPRFANEALLHKASDGDLLIQVCSNDSQVCVHAIRNLTRIAFGTASLRWGQIGYGRTSSTSKAQETPRNLFGFKDGTNNLKSEDGDEKLNRHVWVQPGDSPEADWLTGGSYFIVRKIHMMLEVWDRLSLREQEEVIGREKRHGAPLSVNHPVVADEFTPMDFTAKGNDGDTIVPGDAHVAIVSPKNNDGHSMLRRGYNFTDGNDSLGRLDAGLFFIAYVRDPRTNFYPILKKMTETDAMTEYLQHRASALFAIPPGIGPEDTMVGQKLFA